MSEELNENELEGVSGGAGLPKGSPGRGGVRKPGVDGGRGRDKEFEPDAPTHPPVAGTSVAPTINPGRVGRGGRR